MKCIQNVYRTHTFRQLNSNKTNGVAPVVTTYGIWHWQRKFAQEFIDIIYVWGALACTANSECHQWQMVACTLHIFSSKNYLLVEMETFNKFMQKGNVSHGTNSIRRHRRHKSHMQKTQKCVCRCVCVCAFQIRMNEIYIM